MCKTPINSYTIAVSSAQRSGGDNNNFTYRLRSSAIGKGYRFKYICIPFTWAVCKSGSSTRLEWQTGAINYSADIEEGTYTPEEMVAELNSVFAASGDPDTKTWSFDSKNLKFTVSSSVSTNYEYNTDTQGLMDILGFTSTQFLIGSYVTSANACQLNQPNLIGIKSSTFNGFLPNVGSDLGTISGLNKGATSNSYQIVIPNTASFGNFIEYDGSTSEFLSWKSGLGGGVNEMDFGIYDLSTNELIDLQGANWSLIIEILYDLV